MMIEQEKATLEQIQAIEELRDRVWNILQQRIQHDEKFATTYREFSNFYIRKFVNIGRSEEEKAMLFELIETTINIQFYHGYAIMLGIIQDLMNSDEFFLDKVKSSIQMPLSELRNQIGVLMKMWLGEVSDKWYLNEEVLPYNMIILRDYPTIFETYQNALMEISNYGAFHALVYSDLFKPVELPREGTEAFLLGQPYDLNFLNPQLFMKAQYISTQHEIWDIFSILNERENELWLGTIHLSSISKGINQTDVYYILSFTLMNNIREEERLELMANILDKIPEEIRAVLQIRTTTAEEMEVVSITI